jgi:hypothetical protein
MQRNRKFLSLLAVAGLAAGVLASVGSGPAGAAGTTTIYVPKSACAAARPGHLSCFAQKLVRETVPTTAARTALAGGVAETKPAFGNGPVGGYSPAELAKAYGFDPNAATTQTVAIVDAFADPSVVDDLNAFDSHYRITPPGASSFAETSASFRVLNQSGGTDLSAVKSDLGWAGEITLDVDAVRGLCHKCKIVLIEANTNDNANLGAAVNTAVSLGAKIVSNSYGGPETDPENTPAVKADYDHHGVAILASSGDDGWYGWDVSNAGCPGACTTAPTDDVPSTPASYNTVVGVGGTALHVNPDGTRANEEVWNDNGPADIYGYNLGAAMGAAGSGCSTTIAPKLWQAKVAKYATLGCGASLRNGVDVAAIADPFTGFDTFETTLGWCPSGGTDGTGNNTCPSGDPQWETFGGTSLASPVVAAMWALAGGPGGVTYPSLSLYGHFKSTAGSTYDVTVGGTGDCDTATPGFCAGGGNPNNFIPGQDLDCGWSTTDLTDTTYLANRFQCYAQPGYDGVSGVGTPKGLTVFKAMNPTAKISFSGTIKHGVSKSFSGGGSTDPFPGGSISSYAWNWGDGHTSTGKNVSHTYGSKGSRTITLKVTDNYGRSNTKKITVTVT